MVPFRARARLHTSDGTDQQFAEPWPIARLLGVVSLNPRALGIGIDENTSSMCSAAGRCTTGGTAAYDSIRTLHKRRGGVIAGTSAGAAAMGQVMLMGTSPRGAEKHG